MPGSKTLIDPSKEALTHWLKHARLGDQCRVLTAQGDVYARLTKLKPATAKQLATAFAEQDSFLNNKAGLMELLESLGNVAVHV